MPKVIEALARRQIKVCRPGMFDLERPDAERQRLAENGTVLPLTKGYYALVPDDQREPSTAWRPTIEGAGLGIAAALYGPDNVALVGPSAARARRCYPSALGAVWIAVPKQLRSRPSIIGEIRFVKRDVTKLDLARVDTDLGTGWATSVEQTALDLCRNRPDWIITESTRIEMIQLLADKIDWTIIDYIAIDTRSVSTLRRLRTLLALGHSFD